MPGCYEDALAAHDAFVTGDFRHLLSEYGSNRIVYLINGVVYKVERDAQALGQNELEWTNIVSTRANLPAGVFYPQVSLFEVLGTQVIAMDYIKGHLKATCYCTADEECDTTCLGDLEDIVSPYLDDTSGFNVIVNDEGIWIIDAA